MTASITTAIRADAATSDAEGRRDLAGHLADFRAALLDEAALIAASDRSRFDSEVATLTATRDIVIGQRETAQRERDEARGLLGALTADLNATREKLTAAEASRDSLQAECDRAKSDVSDLHESWMRKVDTVAADRDRWRDIAKGNQQEAIAANRRTDEAIADRDTARTALVEIADKLSVNTIDVTSPMVAAQCCAEVAELRARSEIGGDAEQLRCDLQSCRDENSALIDRIAKVRAEAKRASDGRDAFCEAVMAALGSDESTADVLASIEALKSERSRFKAEAAELRARPVLTSGRLAAAILACRDLTPAGSAPGSMDHAAGILRYLGDGPVTLPAQDAAAALWKAIDDQIVVEAEKVRDGSGVDWHSAYSGAIGTRAKAEAIVRAALASLGAPATTPSKPADVFAGVSIEELAGIYAASFGATTAQSPARIGAIRAVLDALRVKLVAPVDPEEFAQALAIASGSPGSRPYTQEAIRSTLDTRSIPVTPEAGK